MIGKNLDQAYMNFDPARPLPGASEFYVKRKNSPLEAMKRVLLRDSPGSPKFLFSGQRGTGKSTELNTLMMDEEIWERYFVVHYSVWEVLDTAGLDYTDLLFSIGAQIFIKAINAKVKLRERLLEELSIWKDIIGKDFFGDGEGLGNELGLEAFFIRSLSRLRMEYTSREKMRRIVEQRLSELINIINLMIAEIELKVRKKVLVAIDDLDKPDLKEAREIFYERQIYLTQPCCGIIYTIPMAILYSPEAGQVMQAFTESYVLPNVTITKHDDDRSPDREGRAVMKEFIEKRMSLELIHEDALEYAISISGGVFREMARIMGMAADNAIARGEEKIEGIDVEEAESEIRNQFRRMLEAEDYGALKEIHKIRELKGSETCAKLLHNLSILEYRNNENWCDVHPIVVPLIEGETT